MVARVIISVDLPEWGQVRIGRQSSEASTSSQIAVARPQSKRLASK